MTAPVISVQNLGKRYRIGLARKRPRNLREALSRAAGASFRYLQSRLRAATEEEIIWALKDVSFEVRQGEVLGIIGSNGAGKSTLLKILSRITDPTTGKAFIRGRVNSLLEVGTGFHPELTGRENIYMNAALHGMPRAEIRRKIGEIIDFSEIEKFIDTPVKRYSSGMYTRLAFAVAAHLEPDILIIDEVLAVGDMEFQKKSLGKMSRVAQEGRTVLFVSHNMFSIQHLCTRAILLQHGGIQAEGDVGKVVKKYLIHETRASGEISWSDPAAAPGDQRGRVKTVRIVSEDRTSGVVDFSRDIHIEVDYWNLEPEIRLVVSVHLFSATGVCILTSANSPDSWLKPDPLSGRPFPPGLFRTRCTIPGGFLNDGRYTITIYLNQNRLPDVTAGDNIARLEHVLEFDVKETGAQRIEYRGEWLGLVRPLLAWATMKLDDTTLSTSGTK